MPTGIGESLRASRREAGTTLADAAAETKIREAYLYALEQEDFAALGGGVYVKGFLKSYAKFLGMDPEPLLAVYRERYEPREDIHRLASQPLETVPESRPAAIGVVAVVAVLAVVVLAVIGMGGDDDPGDEGLAAPDPIASASPSASPEPSASAEPVGRPSPTATPTPTPTGPPAMVDAETVDLELSVDGRPSWIRVVVDDETQLERIVDPGTTETFSGEEIRLRIGAPESASIVVNGEPQEDFGSPGQPVNVRCAAGELVCTAS